MFQEMMPMSQGGGGGDSSVVYKEIDSTVDPNFVNSGEITVETGLSHIESVAYFIYKKNSSNQVSYTGAVWHTGSGRAVHFYDRASGGSSGESSGIVPRPNKTKHYDYVYLYDVDENTGEVKLLLPSALTTNYGADAKLLFWAKGT